MKRSTFELGLKVKPVRASKYFWQISTSGKSENLGSLNDFKLKSKKRGDRTTLSLYKSYSQIIWIKERRHFTKEAKVLCKALAKVLYLISLNNNNNNNNNNNSVIYPQQYL